jgi:alanine racemase
VDHHRVWADIDLDALTNNLAEIRRRAGRRVALVLVAKADAYGHGAVAVAHHAVRCGVEALGVGNSAEALELRRAGVCAPILILGTIVDEEAAACVLHDVQIGLHARDRCRMLDRLCARLGVPGKVHLNVDTGWGQLGVQPGRALDLLEDIRRSTHLQLCGVMTHMSSPLGALDASTVQQQEVFARFLETARARGLLAGWIHAANSACLFTEHRPLYDAVRPGISAYGILPEDLGEDLQPVMSLRTRIVFLKDLPVGSTVGYAGTWRAERSTRIATVPLGYKDGVPFRLSNCGEMLVRGQRAPIVGRISMDYSTLDVGHIPGARVGDEVVVFGKQGEQVLRVEELAARAGTIPYELTCAIGRSVRRCYHSKESNQSIVAAQSKQQRASDHSRALSGARDLKHAL